MKTILVPIDFSLATHAVVNAAAGLARPSKGTLILVHVVRPPIVVSEYGGTLSAASTSQADDMATAARLLSHWAKDLVRRGLKVKTVQRSGIPVAEILRQATRLRPDALVMGSHGHTAFYDLFIGGTTSGVLKNAKWPVLIVPAVKKPARRKRK